MKLDRFKVFLIAIVLWAGIYLPGLGMPEFKGEEAHRTLPAVTMLETGNWLMPYIAGEPYFNKPPGINWLVAISYLVTGVQNEFTSRLVSVVFILFFISMIIWMKSQILDINGKLIASIIFLTAVSLIEKGRLIEIETVYICLTGMAILWWMNKWSLRSNDWVLWIPAGFILGFGMLVKGPPILLFFYCPVIASLLYSKQLKKLFCVSHILSLLILLAMNYTWAYFGPMQYSQEAMAGTLWHDMILRLKPKTLGYWAENILESVVAFMPWTFFIPALWDKKLTVNVETEHYRLFRGCRIGFVIGFLAIMLMPQTETRYVLPVFSLGSILLGWIISKHKGLYSTDRAWKNIILTCFVLACVTAIIGYIKISDDSWAVVVLTITVLITVFALKKKDELNSAVDLSLSTGTLIMILMLQYTAFYIPGVQIPKNEKFRPAVKAVSDIVGPDETIYIYRSEYETWLYYIRKPFKHLHKPEEIDNTVKYLIVEKIRREELEKMPDYLARRPQSLYKYEERIKGGYQLIELHGTDENTENKANDNTI